MRKPVFLILVLVSGAAAGLVHDGAVLVLVEPYLDYAIEIENQQLFVSGAAQDTAEFRSQFDEFRIMSALSAAAFWISLGIILGLLWDRYVSAARLHAPPRYMAIAGMGA